MADAGGALWDAGGEPLRALELRCEQLDREWTVRVEVGRNDDPAALGCPDFARGFPWCRATIEPVARGYNDFLGWIQLFADSARAEGPEVRVDTFIHGDVSQPFLYYGYSPTFFDAPHRRDGVAVTCRADTFLAAMGDAFEAFALLGFSWGYEVDEDGEISILGPEPLSEADWATHLPALRRNHPRWTFLEGFAPRRSLSLLDDYADQPG